MPCIRSAETSSERGPSGLLAKNRYFTHWRLFSIRGVKRHFRPKDVASNSGARWARHSVRQHETMHRSRGP